MKCKALTFTSCIVLTAFGCQRHPQTPAADSKTPLPMQHEIDAYPPPGMPSGTGEATREERLQQWHHEQVAVRHGLDRLSGVSGLKRRMWTFYLFRALDANEASKESPSKKETIEAALKEKFAWKDWVYRKELALLASVAPTPETLKLQSEAEPLISKWDERFPNDPEVVIMREDLEKFDRESKPIMEQLIRLPKLTPKQLEEEIAALPPPPKPGSADR